MLTAQEIGELTRAVIEKIRGELPLPQFHPGTVVSVSDDGIVSVSLDADDDADPVQAEPLQAGIAADQRVMVLFQPPRACFIIGVIQT